MKFFVDENLSPQLVTICHERGYDATCSRDRGMLRAKDRADVTPLLYAEERIIITEDWDDFDELFLEDGVHYGLIAMPSRRLESQIRMLQAALDFIEREAERAGELPASYMINRAVHVDEDGHCEAFETQP